MVGARVRRQQVAYAQGRGLSSRRACALLSVARSTLGYQSRLAVLDGSLLLGSIGAISDERLKNVRQRLAKWVASEI